jgi:bifunctional oligoribonuclease and PAP phosphatase NrnA
MNKSFKRIRSEIEKANTVVLTTHLLPDGDAIGSEFALYYYILKKGKKVCIINHNESPDHLLFLDEDRIIKRFLDDVDGNTKLINEADLLFVVDTNEYSRIKSMSDAVRNSPAKKICIDHHQGLDKNGYYDFISDTESPATSQILYDFICDDNPDYIDKKIADNLYAGIMTDTGSFKYPRTTEKTFLICADLIKRGTDPVYMYDKIYNNVPTDKVKLLSRFIESLTFHFKGTLAVGIITQQDFMDFHSDVKDVEGFSAFLMSMKNIKAGFLIVELPDSCKISFRSKGNIKMNEFARIFNGGGHMNAAGATVENSQPVELKERLLGEYKTFLSKHEKKR